MGIERYFEHHNEGNLNFDAFFGELQHFDGTDFKNWRIVGFIVNVLVADIILTLFELSHRQNKLDFSKVVMTDTFNFLLDLTTIFFPGFFSFAFLGIYKDEE